jgi:hypothetical protein
MHADALTPQDFGLDASMPFFRSDSDGRRPKVTYLHFGDSPQFTVTFLKTELTMNEYFAKTDFIFTNHQRIFYFSSR